MLGWIVLAFVGCFVLERSRPGWRLPVVRTWPWRVLVVNGVQLGVVLLAGVSWERWAQRWSVLDLGSSLSPTVGGAIAYFVGFVLWPFATVALQQSTGSFKLAFLCIPVFMLLMAGGVWLCVPEHAGKELNKISV